jgi:hypothetical protein
MISKVHLAFGATMLVAMSAAVSAVVFSNWDPFPPTDYEDCAGRAAKTAKSKDGLSVLLSLCRSEFKGRRKPIGGGYAYYDESCSDLGAFTIKGPNPTPSEIRDINQQCLSHLQALQEAEAEKERRAYEVAEQKRRAQRAAQETRDRQLRAAQEARDQQLQAAQEARDRQLQAAQEARATAERQRQIRKSSAMSGVQVRAAGFKCWYVYSDGTCPPYVNMKVEVTNGSKESLSSVTFGLAFVPTDGACPSSYAEKHTLNLTLSSGETRGDYIERIDAALSKFRICTAVVDLRFVGE